MRFSRTFSCRHSAGTPPPGAPLNARFGGWNVGHLDVTRNVGGFRATRRKHREFVAMNFDPSDA